MVAFIVEIIVISTQPNDSKAMRKKGIPWEPIIERFTFEVLPDDIPIRCRHVHPKQGRLELGIWSRFCQKMTALLH